MITLRYNTIPHSVIETKGIRFVANTPREALKSAKQKGYTGEPILMITKLGLTIAYFPSDELRQIALDIHNKREAEKALKEAEVKKIIPKDRAGEIFKKHMDAKGIKFRFPNI